MTVVVINHGSTQSITIRTAVIRPITKLNVDKPQDYFRKDVSLMLAIQ
jgi:hypothetical protein